MAKKIKSTFELPAEVQAVFAKYDQERPAAAGIHEKLFDYLLEKTEWREGSGPIPGVFGRGAIPRGHRCIWSAVWASSRGVFRADNYLPLETMTVEQLVYEALDALYRGEGGTRGEKLKELMLHYLTGEIGNPSYWISQVVNLVRALRPNYPEFVLSTDLPDSEVLGMVSWRPGYAQPVHEVPTLVKKSIMGKGG